MFSNYFKICDSLYSKFLIVYLHEFKIKFVSYFKFSVIHLR